MMTQYPPLPFGAGDTCSGMWFFKFRNHFSKKQVRFFITTKPLAVVLLILLTNELLKPFISMLNLVHYSSQLAIEY